MKKLIVSAALLFVINAVFAQTKISEMPTFAGNASESWVPIVSGGKNYKTLAKNLSSGKVDSITVKTSVANSDTIYFWKNGLRYIVGYIPKGGAGSASPVITASNFIFFTGAQRTTPDGNTVLDILDDNSGQYFTATKRSTIAGRNIIDAWVDNVTIWKKGSDYWVRNIEGADVDLRWYLTDTTGTTSQVAEVQQCVNTAIRIFKSVRVPEKGMANLTGGTVLINKEIGQVFNFYSNGRVVKDYQTLKQNMGFVFAKYDSGDMFRINLKADGSPYANYYDYSLNISMSGFQMRGSDTANVVGIRGYRTRGLFEALSGVYLNYTILHDWVAPAGYVGTWNNYSDQSIYRNIRMMYSTKGGIKTTNADASDFNGIYFEYPKAGCLTGLWIRNSYGFTVRNVLHANGNHEQNISDTTDFIKIEVCRAFSVEGIHAENIEFKNLIRLISPFGWHISNVHTRFEMRTLLSMYRSRAGKFEQYYDWTNTRSDTTDVDFRDEDSTSTDFTWNQMHLVNFTTFATRAVKTNRVESSSWGFYLNRKGVEDLVYDKYVKAVYNYGTSPHYQVPSNVEIDVIDFPQITQATTVRLPNPATYSGRTLTLINRNKTFDYNTTLINYLLWFPDSTSTSNLPQNRTLLLKSDSTKWNLVSDMDMSFVLRDSVIRITEYLNVNNNRFPKNGNLLIVANVDQNTTLDLPSATATKGRIIKVVKTDNSGFYLRAKSVVGGQLIMGAADDTIRSDGGYAVRFYESDGEHYYNLGGGSSTYYIGGGGDGTGDVDTATNYNTAGIGVFHSKNGSDLRFKGVRPASNKVTVTDNGTNRTVDIDVVPANFTGIPQSGVSALQDSLDAIKARLNQNDTSSFSLYRTVDGDSIKMCLEGACIALYAPIATGAAYTATGTPGTNVGSMTVTEASWRRNGIIIEANYILSVTATEAGLTEFEVSLPVPVSSGRLAGQVTYVGGGVQASGLMYLLPTGSSNKANMMFAAPSGTSYSVIVSVVYKAN